MCLCHKTSRMLLVIGLVPFCAGLRGSSFELMAASLLYALGAGMLKESAKGLLTNSVARGDIRASSAAAILAAAGRAEDESSRTESCAAIWACSFWSCSCSRRVGDEILPRSFKPVEGGAKPDSSRCSTRFCVLSDEERFRGLSSSRTDPMPKDARSAGRSNMDGVKLVDVGDMMPKLSSTVSPSVEGCSGVNPK